MPSSAGINFRVIDMLAIGSDYWVGLNELTAHVKPYDFNVTRGYNFRFGFFILKQKVFELSFFLCIFAEKFR